MFEKTISKLTTMPNAALLLAAAGVGSLGFALTMQYGFGVMPCELCLWQRVPFVAVAALSFVALIAPKYTRLCFVVGAVLLLANAGLALFHSGVERHWWEFHSACTGSALERVKSVEDLRQELLGTPVVRCDEISWSMFGLTMANMNIVYSAVLAMFAMVVERK